MKQSDSCYEPFQRLIHISSSQPIIVNDINQTYNVSRKYVNHVNIQSKGVLGLYNGEESGDFFLFT